MFLEASIFFLLFSSIFLQQPLSLAGALLFLALFVRGYISFFFSSWFSLSVFLVYIGGMLVLFGYVIVLVPNFVFKAKAGGFLVFFLFFLFFSSGSSALQVGDFSFSFFELRNLWVYLGLGLILFFGLIRVAKVCFFQGGALRPFIFYV